MPIQSTKKQDIVQRGENFYRIFPLVKDSVTYTSIESPELAFEAARQFGRFTEHLSGFNESISVVGDMMRTYLAAVSEEETDFETINVREDYFVAIVEGYLSEMKAVLTEEEQKGFIYAGKFMIYMQSVRFLADYLMNEVYYGSKYEGQNFNRGVNQLYLLNSLKEKEERLFQKVRQNKYIFSTAKMLNYLL